MGSPRWNQGVGSSSSAVVPTVPYSDHVPLDTSLRNRDTVFVSTTLRPGETATTLRVVRFGSDVLPSGAIVRGIKLTLTRNASQEGLKDVSMQLMVNGVPLPITEKYPTTPSGYWSRTEKGAVVGDVDDLWGLEPGFLTPTIVNSRTFGVSITTKNVHASRVIDAFINEITMRVAYTIDGSAVSRVIEKEDSIDSVADSKSHDVDAFVYVGVGVGLVVAAVVAVVAAVLVRRRRSRAISASPSNSADAADTSEVALP